MIVAQLTTFISTLGKYISPMEYVRHDGVCQKISNLTCSIMFTLHTIYGNFDISFRLWENTFYTLEYVRHDGVRQNISNLTCSIMFSQHTIYGNFDISPRLSENTFFQWNMLDMMEYFRIFQTYHNPSCLYYLPYMVINYDCSTVHYFHFDFGKLHFFNGVCQT